MTNNTIKNGESTETEGFAHGVAPGVKWAVIIMGIMLIIGMVVVFSTIIYRTVKLSSGESVSKVEKIAPYPEISLPLPQDGSVSSVALDGNRMVVHISKGDEVTILVLDIKRGQVISKTILKKTP